MSKIRNHKRITASIAAALLVCVAVGVAAVMLSGQKGKGTGHFQQLQNISVQAGTAPGTGPYPVAGSDGDLAVKLSNPNGVPIKVISVARDTGGGVIASTDTVGCNSIDAALSVNPVTLTTAQQTAATVAAGASNVQVLLPGVVHVVSSPSAACQTADFTVPLDLTVQAG
jgi:hypothetical protein